MSRAATGTTPTIEPAVKFAGAPTHGLFSEPSISAVRGLRSPDVVEVPNAWSASLPLTVVTSPSSLIAKTEEGHMTEAPATQAARAAVAHSFLVSGPSESGFPRGNGEAGFREELRDQQRLRVTGVA